ncbi:MAG TPA: hypothetical protein VM553_15400, partial [Dongiaceae bacterium]|nr:hypothetical protein [Dongiaceae bacterium]
LISVFIPMVLAGSEAYQAALLYRTENVAAQARVPGAEEVYNDLSSRRGLLVSKRQLQSSQRGISHSKKSRF